MAAAGQQVTEEGAGRGCAAAVWGVEGGGACPGPMGGGRCRPGGVRWPGAHGGKFELLEEGGRSRWRRAPELPEPGFWGLGAL